MTAAHSPAEGNTLVRRLLSGASASTRRYASYSAAAEWRIYLSLEVRDLELSG